MRHSIWKYYVQINPHFDWFWNVQGIILHPNISDTHFLVWWKIETQVICGKELQFRHISPNETASMKGKWNPFYILTGCGFYLSVVTNFWTLNCQWMTEKLPKLLKRAKSLLLQFYKSCVLINDTDTGHLWLSEPIHRNCEPPIILN